MKIANSSNEYKFVYLVMAFGTQRGLHLTDPSASSPAPLPQVQMKTTMPPRNFLNTRRKRSLRKVAHMKQ